MKRHSVKDVLKDGVHSSLLKLHYMYIKQIICERNNNNDNNK